ncbi:MAG: geranylgeranylglyceryl/heptaprenylglyceryl phosphate synthase [Saprospiraceae bacterium]
MAAGILQSIKEAHAAGKKLIILVVDPDMLRIGNLVETLKVSVEIGVDYILLGGSVVLEDVLEQCIQQIREHCNIPIILFPGNQMQISNDADAILLLSLISGRNPDYLIGRHVEAAPRLFQSKLEVIPTGYILIDGGRYTAVNYITQTIPIPADKPEIAACTALAGAYLGLKMFYLEAGSGADKHVPVEMISMIRKFVDLPILVGGGIKRAEQAAAIFKAGADAIVIGTAFEKDPELARAIAGCRDL